MKLADKLRMCCGSAISSGIVFVGGYTEGFAGLTTDKTITLTSLTGGIDTQPSAGDIIVCLVGGVKSSTYPNGVANLPTGYTNISNDVASDTYIAVARICYKFMTSTPDTSLVISGGTGNAANGGTCSVLVFRGVNQANPLDVTSVVNITNNILKPDPSAITPIHSGAFIVAGGVGGLVISTAYFTSSDLTNFISSRGSDTLTSLNGIGYKEWTGGAFDPAQFSYPADADTTSSIAYTIALRPA